MQITTGVSWALITEESKDECRFLTHLFSALVATQVVFGTSLGRFDLWQPS